jgi:LysM repeat protein
MRADPHPVWSTQTAPPALPGGAWPVGLPLAEPAAEAARPSRVVARHLRSAAPTSLAAGVLAAGVENVDLGLQRLGPRRRRRRGTALLLVVATLLFVLGAGLLWQDRALGGSVEHASAVSPGANSRLAGSSAPPAASVELESLRATVAAPPVEVAPAPGGLVVSTRPIESNYTVVAGDTLERIALRFSTTVDAIVGMNNLRDRHSLQVGQKLIIP